MKISNNNIEVRVISEIDLNGNSCELIELLKDNYIINFPNSFDFSEYANSNFNDMLKYTKAGSAYIIGAFLDRQVIGFAWAYKRIFIGEPRLHISHIIVSKEFRGYGLGSRMIDFIEKIAIKKNIKVIELLTSSENRNTIQFYNSHGFNITRVQFEKNLGENNDY